MSGNLYAQLVNNTGAALNGLQISYDVEKYRNGSNPAGYRIQLFYSPDGNTWTNAGPDFLTSFAPDADNNGFATAPGATVSVANKTLNVSIASGASFFVVWNYSVNSGSTTTNAPALAIDNVLILGIGAVVATNPSGTGSANPNSVLPGETSTLTVAVTAGTNPTSSGLAVTADRLLSSSSTTALVAATQPPVTTSSLTRRRFRRSPQRARSRCPSRSTTRNRAAPAARSV
jgi:hypothetical protein